VELVEEKMDVNTCRRCEEDGREWVIVDEDNHLVCSTCGLVIEEKSLFVSEGGVLGSTQEQIARLGTDPLKSIKRCIQTIAGMLALPEPLLEQVMSLLTDITDKKQKYAKSSMLQAASVVYIVLRKNHRPYSLVDLADRISCNVFDIGRVYSRIVQENKIQLEDVDPSLFIDGVCSQLISDPSASRVASNHAARLVELAKEDWIHTGRHPNAVAAAAIILAIESNVKLLEKPSAEKVSDMLHTKAGTVAARIKEMKKIMVAKRDLVPWGHNINMKSVVHNLPHLIAAEEIKKKIALESERKRSMSEIQLQARSKVVSLPPAYEHSKLLRDKREIRVNNAKKRLQATLNGERTPLEIDSEDLIIEKLLMQGVDEEIIMNGWYTADPHTYEAKGDYQEEKDVGEDDIPEREMNKFIRSHEEITLLTQLEKGEFNDDGTEENNSKRRRISCPR